MLNDEDQIRALVQTWQSATMVGDVDAVLDLMTDDVIFLVPGKPPTHKAEFAAALRGVAGGHRPKVESASEVQEVQVSGDMAYMLTKLSVTSTPTEESQAVTRAGHTLTVLRRVGGKWLLARDANLLSPAR